MNRTAKILVFLGLIMGLLSTLYLYWGSIPLSWNEQTVGGVSSQETAFGLARQKETIIGIYLLSFAFLFQLLGTFWKDIHGLWRRITSYCSKIKNLGEET